MAVFLTRIVSQPKFCQFILFILDPESQFEFWRSSLEDGFAKNWRAVHFRLGAIVSLTVGRRQHVLYHDMFISTKPALLASSCTCTCLLTFPPHYPHLD